SALGPLARASFALHAELAQKLGADYGYRRLDTFMLAARERGRLGGGHRVAAPSWLDDAGVVTGVLGSTDTTAQVHPARFTTALLDAARARGCTLRLGVVEDVVQRDGVTRGVRVDGATLDADAVVLAMGPWTTRAVRGLRLPTVRGLKGYSVTVDVGAGPAARGVDHGGRRGDAGSRPVRPGALVGACWSIEGRHGSAGAPRAWGGMGGHFGAPHYETRREGGHAMELGLSGKNAIVTGGSLGIGKAIALELAREGVNVAIAARSKGPLEAAAHELATATGRRIIPIVADVTSKAQVDGMVAQAAAQLGGVHILVNSGSPPGGSATATGPIETVVDEDLLHDFNVKYVGALRCARAVLPHMK